VVGLTGQEKRESGKWRGVTGQEKEVTGQRGGYQPVEGVADQEMGLTGQGRELLASEGE
jgi:hypothetical protein